MDRRSKVALGMQGRHAISQTTPPSDLSDMTDRRAGGRTQRSQRSTPSFFHMSVTYHAVHRSSWLLRQPTLALIQDHTGSLESNLAKARHSRYVSGAGVYTVMHASGEAEYIELTPCSAALPFALTHLTFWQSCEKFPLK